MKRCQNCQKVLEKKAAPRPDETCPFCGADLHVCFNCRQYSPDARQQCLQPGLPEVKSKKFANDCASFVMREFQEQVKFSGQETAKKKWDDLFDL